MPEAMPFKIKRGDDLDGSTESNHPDSPKTTVVHYGSMMRQGTKLAKYTESRCTPSYVSPEAALKLVYSKKTKKFTVLAHTEHPNKLETMSKGERSI